MKMGEALQTMTEADKARAFDVWLQDYQKNCGSIFNTEFVNEEATIKSHMGPIRAVAAVIADRKPNLAPWTPEVGDDYYSIGWPGVVVSDEWRGAKLARDFGNVFRTREEAEAHAARLRVFNRVCQIRRALGLDDFSPRNLVAYLNAWTGSDEAAAIRAQLEKEGIA